jgi:hypothetical protein
MPKLERRGQVFRYGPVRIGRHWEWLWSAVPLRGRTAIHEYEITNIIDWIQPDTAERWGLPHEADGRFTLAGLTHFLERDRGTIRKEAQLRKRFDAYRGCEKDVLWVCNSTQRIARLKAIAADYSEAHWFTTYPQVQASPRGRIWSGRDDLETALLVQRDPVGASTPTPWSNCDYSDVCEPPSPQSAVQGR